MAHVPWSTFGRIIKRHNGDSGVCTLKCAPARSTLADTLNLQDWRIYRMLATRLNTRAREIYVEEPMRVDLDATAYALDATTIKLCLSLFDWTPFRSTKAAVKMHTLLDLRGVIPVFIHVSDGKLEDVNVLDIFPVEAGASYITNRNTGVIRDQRIALNGFYAGKNYPAHLRRSKFKDPVSDKTLLFLSNYMTLPPLTIASLYEGRWQVELFFKSIKQHLQVKRYLANSENAVKTKIWCAVSTYMLIVIIKK